jgi:molecular chaperone GrpE
MTEPANASAANNNVAAAENAEPGAAATPGASAEPAAASADAAALAQEAADYKDKLLRTLADMENLRRRTERDVAESRAYGIASFARDLLTVADNMRRALDSVRDGGGEAGGGAKALLDGVELTERELHKVLEKHGIKRFDPQGAKFDPNLHQAMFEVPDPNVPAGFVVQVIQPGYMIAERVLRPAMVGVSKGGPKTAPPERSAEETQSG